MELDKKGAATTASNVRTFEGLEMGILSPHSEHVRETHQHYSSTVCSIGPPLSEPRLTSSLLRLSLLLSLSAPSRLLGSDEA